MCELLGMSSDRQATPRLSLNVAQEFAAPGERMIEFDGSRETRNTDVRLYVYDGQVLLSAARLYQGQTTNLGTPGGMFAPVFAI